MPAAVLEVDLLFPPYHDGRCTPYIENHTDPVAAAVHLEEEGRNPVHNPLKEVVAMGNLLVVVDDGSTHHSLLDRGMVVEF